MRTLTLISLISLTLASCEKVVQVELPEAQNLIVIEGLLTDSLRHQYIKITRTNGFEVNAPNPFIPDARVTVIERDGLTRPYAHVSGGNYQSDIPFQGTELKEYRTVIVLADGTRLISDWQRMQPRTEIINIQIKSLRTEENGQSMTIHFPRITSRDSVNFDNYYRWVFFQNDERVTTPEAITIQNDKFFDGNLIPNTFNNFPFDRRDEAKVELHSINASYYNFLNQLKAQSNTVGTVSPTIPSIVIGNMHNVDNPDEIVLGFFATTAISTHSTIVTP